MLAKVWADLVIVSPVQSYCQMATISGWLRVSPLTML